MTPRSFMIEGLDRLGKGTLIDGLKQQLGYFTVIHCSKPERLATYKETISVNRNGDLLRYQDETFINMFHILNSAARVIMDRAHLGEVVYAPLYRHYPGTYVFNTEKAFSAQLMTHVRLILLTEDFRVSKHFVEDGESFDATKREVEQDMFINAFNKSILPNKRIICVTDPITGEFRGKADILAEALA